MQIILIFIFVALAIVIAVYYCKFYPQQSMPIGKPIEVMTPDVDKYHNDCLHPCIRYCESTGNYYMAQSPYYGWNNALENPIFYESTDCNKWHDGYLMAETPDQGFNTDPCVYVDPYGDVTYIWRECKTKLSYSHNSKRIIVGGKISQGKLKEKKIFAISLWNEGDTVQCPILIKHKGYFYIYAAWYQYEPIRKNLGVAIWKGTSLEEPDFKLQETIPLKSIYTVDKCAQIRMFGHLWFIPKPLKHDIWHFDLFEYDGKLYMVSVAEKGDNIMLSVADDWMHFKTFRKPLVNNHYTENYCGYRQYFYKPTAFVKDDTLHLFYTANAEDDNKRNQLYHTSVYIKDIM